MNVKMTEHLHQARFVSWWRKQYPDDLIFAIPNGGYRGDRKTAMIVGSKLKAEGVLKGVVDLYIPCHKLWIEMKKDHTESPTKEQKEFMIYVESLGDHSFVAHSFEEAKEKALLFLASK